MRPITETVLFDDALEMVMREAQPVSKTEVLALLDADGRVAAADVVAAVDVPPFDRAAMDGYAVVAEDTFGASSHAPKTLTCVGVIYTGQAPSRGISSGECIEIATGAPMPPGADAVVMVEETERDGERGVRVLTPVYPRQHVGRRGADITTGQTVVARGQVLNPSRIGALAATGVTTVDVFAKPAVAILSTGNEIVEPGEPLRAGQIYDINRFTLEAIVARHGGLATALPITADAIDDLSAALAAARAFDIVVFSGGSSVGERDLILDVLRKDGEVLFHGVAVKPGKPTVFGKIGDDPVLRHARLPDLVPVERVHAARAVPAPGRPAATLATADHRAPAGPPHRLHDRPPPVLHRPHRRRPRRTRLQGLRRHHQHGPRRRLHRNSRTDRRSGSGNSGDSEDVLTVEIERSRDRAISLCKKTSIGSRMRLESPIRQAPDSQSITRSSDRRSQYRSLLFTSSQLMMFHQAAR